MSPEQIDTSIQIISGVIIAVSSAWGGYSLKKRKQLESKPEQNKSKVVRMQCHDHKEVVENVKQIPLVVQSMDTLEKKIDMLAEDMREMFRVIRTHEGQIQNLIGKSER